MEKRNLLNNKKSNLGILLVLTILLFQFTIGFDKFNPNNISWLFEARNDWATHYLGWSYFRDSNWQFPLGTISGYNYPIGTNIGFTDSIPLFAFFFKLISFLLPDNFQYIGIWFFVCLFLNGYYSFKIFQYFKMSIIMSFLFTIIIMLNPVFFFRQLHPALCAQWLLIGSIFLYISTNKSSNLKKAILHHLFLLILSCFITPYLAVVVLGFFIIFIFKHFYFEKSLNFKKSLIYVISSLFLVFISWFLTGLINFSKHIDNDSTGFYGIYKLNLNALYNPLGYSKILPAQKLVSGYQQDAFAYMGFGMLLLAIIVVFFSIFIFIKNKQYFFSKKLIPVLLFGFFLIIFATTGSVSFNENNIFAIPLMDKWTFLGDVFRASGRFFWSVYLLLLFYIIFVFNKIAISNTTKTVIVLLITIIQVYDLELIYDKKPHQKGDYKPALNLVFWNSILPNFNNVITVMPFNNDLVNFQDYQEIAYLAYKNKNNVTNGNLARNDGKAIKEYTNQLINEIINGKYSKENIYLTNKENLKYFSPAYKKGLIKIINSDGYYFIYSSSKKINSLPDNSQKDKLDFELAKKENLVPAEFESISLPLPVSSGEVSSNFENELYTNSVCQIKGWAYIEKTNNNVGDSIFVYLKNDKHLYKKHCVQTERKDITIVFKKENLDNSGFESFAFTNNIEKGKYELIIAIKDKKGDLYYSNSNKIVNIGFSEFVTPKEFNTKIEKNQNLGLGVDVFEFKNNILHVKGWAAYKEFESKLSTVEVVFIKKGELQFSSETLSNVRKDVTDFIKNNINYDDSGFETKIDTKSLPKGEYLIGFRIVNKPNSKDSYILSDKTIIIN